MALTPRPGALPGHSAQSKYELSGVVVLTSHHGKPALALLALPLCERRRYLDGMEGQAASEQIRRKSAERPESASSVLASAAEDSRAPRKASVVTRDCIDRPKARQRPAILEPPQFSHPRKKNKGGRYWI